VYSSHAYKRDESGTNANAYPYKRTASAGIVVEGDPMARCGHGFGDVIDSGSLGTGGGFGASCFSWKEVRERMTDKKPLPSLRLDGIKPDRVAV
jgi:hypothetical protein